MFVLFSTFHLFVFLFLLLFSLLLSWSVFLQYIKLSHKASKVSITKGLSYIYNICRHACFGVYASSVQLCNTSRYVTQLYLSICECSHQTHVGQHGYFDVPRHAQSVMGPECSNYHEGSELCYIYIYMTQRRRQKNGNTILTCIQFPINDSF